MDLLILDGVGSVDLWPRPRRRLWARFGLPYTSNLLLVWRDGRVLEIDWREDPSRYDADRVMQQGNGVVPGSWEEPVLLAAGYTLRGGAP